MKELIERLREGVADTGVLIKSAASVNATMNESADALEQQAKQIEELAAALAEKDLLLLRIASTTQTNDLLWWQIDARAAIALQPHASLVAKIKADAAREAANELGVSDSSRKALLERADRIQREVK